MTRETAPAAVINRALADRLWPGESVVGRRVRRYETDEWATIVGVVGDVEMRLNASNERLPLQVYLPLDTAAAPHAPSARRTFVYRRLLVRTSDPTAFTAALKSHVWRLDRTLPVTEIELLQDRWDQTFAPQLLVLLMMSVFSVLAVALAAAGLFAVIAHAVAHRTHEIGIRVALGATRRDIFRVVMTRAVALTLVGLAAGLAGAAALSRTLTALLYQVSPYDPASFAAVSLGLVVVALAACWLPAKRALAVDPSVALRAE
jgi:putative ABC transport system permease protein